MPHRFADIAFTPAVKKVQARFGSRDSYAHFTEGLEDRNSVLGDAEAAFVGARDSFYLATVSETGWPYLQHRGGAPGFVRVLSSTEIGFADFRGNRQYVSVGNLLANDRVSLFFMDYANRRRLKLFGRARSIEPDDQATLSRLEMPNYRARVERGIVIKVEAFDWNCPQHIVERFTRDDVQLMMTPLTARIEALEADLARLAATAPRIPEAPAGR